MSGIVTWIAAGLVVGAAGRLLLPGPRASWPVSFGSGLLGGFLGGLAATWLGMGGVAELAPRALVLALLAAALLVISAHFARTLRERRPTDTDAR